MSETLIHNLEEKSKQQKITSKKYISYLMLLLVIVLGIFSGYLISQALPQNSSSTKQTTQVIPGKKNYGTKNTKLFPDSTEGVLKKGGINGEGTHHLERKGGPSQNVYLTSSVIDLNQFVNKKVKVWGKTYTAQTAGWLMDVGYLELK